MKKLWLLLLAFSAQAQVPDAAPDFSAGRYLAKYPGMYVNFDASQQTGETVFGANGEEQDSAAQSYGAGNIFESSRAQATLEWHFPWFESEKFPFISQRTWMARAAFGYTKLNTEGPIRAFNASYTDEPLEDEAGGLTDLQLDFGPLLLGSKNWRTRTATPHSLLLKTQFILPVGERDPGSPHNAGGNVFGLGYALGYTWQARPWLLLDAGAATRRYSRSEEPAYGAQEPTQRGDDTFFDLSLTARLAERWFLAASVDRREGDPNRYEKVRFTSTMPEPDMGMDGFPDPAATFDEGTRATRLGFSATYFVTQRVGLTLIRIIAQSGRSGQFTQTYLQQRQNCTATEDCDPQPYGSAPADGLVGARVFADDYWMLSLRYSAGQGDFWLRGP